MPSIPRTPPDIRIAPLVGLLLAPGASPALAGRGDISHRPEDRAVRACKGDALRICPGKMFGEVAVARCLATKRSKLTPTCRGAYDDVEGALRR